MATLLASCTLNALVDTEQEWRIRVCLDYREEAGVEMFSHEDGHIEGTIKYGDKDGFITDKEGKFYILPNGDFKYSPLNKCQEKQVKMARVKKMAGYTLKEVKNG